MKALTGVAVVFLTTLAACGSGSAGGSATTVRVALGYYTGTQASFDAITSFHDHLTAVSADVFAVTSAGEIDGEVPADVVAYDRANGISTYACVSNYGADGFDADLAHAAIVTHKETIIPKLVALAKDGSFDGVNIDFEGLASTDRQAFTSFIAELAGALHAGGLQLAISVPGKTEDSPDNTWSWPFDLSSLGKSADLIQLMTYDEHGPWSGSGTGSVAGRAWMESCVKYTVSVIDPRKALIGLPAYGYDWNVSTPDDYSDDVSFSWKNVPALLARTGATPRWDPTSQSAYVAYTSADGDHVAWFETSQGITLKTALVTTYDLGGLSMWSLGQEDADFWNAVAAGLE